MDLLDLVRIVGGLVLLVAGAEALVRGASSLARRLGMSPLVVGLTVVAVATSTPELAVTLDAVFSGSPDLAVGNVVGSNIVNVLLILGVSAVVLPLTVRLRLVRLDLPIMVFLSVLLLVLALDGTVSRLDGVILLAGFVGYTAFSVVIGRRRTASPAAAPAGTPAATGAGAAPADDIAEGPADEKPPASVLVSVLLVVAGIALLVLGARFLVAGAVGIAQAVGVSELVIGLTVVAAGTSAPELAASVVAARRGERDMAVGNIVGSNIANIGLILGLPAILARGGIPVPDAAIALDMPLMIATAVALLPVAFTGFVIRRWEGALFVGLYVAYTAYLVLQATAHDALRGFTAVMLWFVLPLVAATLLAVTAYEVGLRRGRRPVG